MRMPALSQVPGRTVDMAQSSSVSEEECQRLLRDYTDATEQFAAMNEVLATLGRSSSDPDAVLDTVVESVRRLCRCHAAQIALIDGDHCDRSVRGHARRWCARPD